MVFQSSGIWIWSIPLKFNDGTATVRQLSRNTYMRTVRPDDLDLWPFVLKMSVSWSMTWVTVVHGLSCTIRQEQRKVHSNVCQTNNNNTLIRSELYCRTLKRSTLHSQQSIYSTKAWLDGQNRNKTESKLQNSQRNTTARPSYLELLTLVLNVGFHCAVIANTAFVFFLF